VVARENPDWWSSAMQHDQKDARCFYPRSALWCFSLRCSSAAPARPPQQVYTSTFGGQNIGNGLVTLWTRLIVMGFPTALAELRRQKLP